MKAIWHRASLGGFAALLFLLGCLTVEVFRQGQPGWSATFVLLAVVAVSAHSRHRKAESRAGWTDLHLELERARRFGRTFAVAAFAVNPSDVADAARVLGATHRSVDSLWADEAHVLILMPEMKADAAETASIRLVDRLGQTGIQARFGIATFPDVALTSLALLEAAKLASTTHRRLAEVIDLRAEDRDVHHVAELNVQRRLI